MLDSSTLDADDKLTKSYIDLPHYKILIIGDTSIGKTSLIHRYISNKFSEDINSSIGLDYKEKMVQISSDNKVVLRLWDTAGSEKFRSIAQSYFRNSDGIILCFDTSDSNSFNNLKGWVNYINEYIQILEVSNKNNSEEKKEEEEEEEEEEKEEEEKEEIFWMEEQHHKPILVLCGLKSDLGKNVINNKDINNFKKKLKCEYCLTSSKNGDGINELFFNLAKELFEKKKAINKFKNKSFYIKNENLEKNNGISESKIACC